jgi:hypothetical protein
MKGEKERETEEEIKRDGRGKEGGKREEEGGEEEKKGKGQKEKGKRRKRRCKRKKGGRQKQELIYRFEV